jgi:hypothetical protein
MELEVGTKVQPREHGISGRYWCLSELPCFYFSLKMPFAIGFSRGSLYNTIFFTRRPIECNAVNS